MRRKASLILSLLFIISLSFITSCSSGGSGGGGPGGGQTQEVKVSGTVLVEGSPPNEAMTVRIISVDSSGTKVDSQTVNTSYSVTNPSLNGNFQATVKAKKGGRIIVTAKGSQTTEAGRVVEFQNQKEVTVRLQANRVITQTVDLNNGIVINSSGKRYLRIAFTKNGQGSPQLITGLSAQNTSNKLIDIAIPVSALNSNTTTVNVSYRSFNPSNPQDYSSFPGDMTDSGDRLVSIGFDYLEITDQNGNDPFNIGSIGAQLVSGEYMRILRGVDCEQINNIRNMLGSLDEDPSKPGIQLTFYAFDFDQGVWVEAGQGTFVDDQNINFTNSEWDTIIQNGCDPNSSSNNNNDGIASCTEYGIFVDENQVCADNNDFVVISVTNPSLEWKNLDYVVPEGREISCRIKVVDQDGDPVPGAWVSASSGCMTFTQGITDQNGEVNLSALGYSDPCTADVNAWYRSSLATETADFDSGNQCELTLTVNNPFGCTVTGRIIDDNNQPVEGFPVQTIVYLNARTMYNWGFTDAQGNFSIPTVCNAQGTVYAKNKSKNYRINNTVDFDEVSDNGTEADVGTIQIVNDPPIGSILMQYGVDPQPGNQIEVQVCATDMENNYDISYILNKNNSNFASGTISLIQGCVYHTDTLASNTPQCYSAEFTDSKGKSAPSTNDHCLSADNSGNYLHLEVSGAGYRDSLIGASFVHIGVVVNGTGAPDIQSASYECDGTTGVLDPASAWPSEFGYFWTLCSDPNYTCNGTVPHPVTSCFVEVTVTNGTQTITHRKEIPVFLW